MFKNLLFIVIFSLVSSPFFAQQSSLSVEKIMQDPKWMGTFPSNIEWNEQSDVLYFNYNKDNDPSDSLYRISLKSKNTIEKVNWREEKNRIPNRGSYNASKTKKIYVKNNALFIYEVKSKKESKVLEFINSLYNPVFLADENTIAFTSENNAYIYNLSSQTLKKITNLKTGDDSKKKEDKLTDKANWLKEENLQLLNVIKRREDKKEASKKYNEYTKEKEATPFYTGKKTVSNIQVSPDAKYVTFNLVTRNENNQTIVPDYIDALGYTVDLKTREKVGEDKTQVELAIYHIEKDTTFMAKTNQLPGITDLPDYAKDYPEKKWDSLNREVLLSRAYFSDNGKNAIVNVRSKDNKDRWITKLNLETGDLETLDRQRDEAWIAGPGIGWSMGGGTMGWLPDNQHIYFQSEVSGYAHLYILDVTNGAKKALTAGNFEVFDPFLSKDKKHWYVTTSEIHPGERHFYKMPVLGGAMEKLTSLAGNNEVFLSPDEKYLAIRHSYSNQPWELFLKKNNSTDKEKQLTYGQSKAFKEYAWRDPQLVNFQAEDGTMVPARLYTPEASVKNNAAVLFVHGAGYLQNAHKWWSLYFREYMFNNMLTDLGYTVLDIDYRGSAGYGRNWRTAIYRHMGGKDLSDQVDGAKYLVAKHGIDKNKIGLYGGSYGGFITLMALFNAPETFASGAALRSVTDWAHYNHGYTSNILNEPANDPIAYRRSSPIYFAEGFKGHLLIAHGIVDENVHFQDVVRLSQRLIELEKNNWEMAIYPAEDHGFIEPSSWIDEYKRILKLFNATLLEN
ncbi:MAG: S9 family peptidase [Flavobacteriaceae bacterium CG_4_9_14_0_8_um_filter_34_30]|nr:MAG: S9 family peptidase [Flavobacteriaceae bacterium CG_4_9_14_0_8_um_filter_34_30]